MNQTSPERAIQSIHSAWEAIVAAWLDAQASPHTRRSYETAWNAFHRFLDAEPWLTTSDDVNAWIGTLRASGQARATIASRLAACANLFDYVTRAAPALLVDPRGRPRSNPFHSPAVTRPRVPAYPRPSPLSDEAVQRTLARINRDCLTGARDAALLMTFLTTGWRSAEVLGLTYASYVEDPAIGQPTHLWRAGRTRREPVVLPAAASTAILHYLGLAERWPLPVGVAVWLPLRVAGVANFGIAQPNPNQPISGRIQGLGEASGKDNASKRPLTHARRRCSK